MNNKKRIVFIILELQNNNLNFLVNNNKINYIEYEKEIYFNFFRYGNNCTWII
jgi:hypothetical protein